VRLPRSIRDADVAGKTVLVRADLNVPLEDGGVADDTRIRASLPTLELLLEQGVAEVRVCSHLGRPKTEEDRAKYAMAPVGARLRQLLPDERVRVLENTRFHPGETTNDEGFARELADGCELYVNDAFGSAHRAHASTEAVAHLLKPAVAGFLMEKELEYLGQLLTNPKHPFVAVLGGAKISGKIDVIRSLLPRVDELLIGGAMACTFFRAMGLEVGGSLVEPDRIELAKELLATSGKKLILPRGACVAPSLERAADARSVSIDQIAKGWAVYDIDEATRHDFAARLLRAKTIFWNGPMGVFETPPFDAGTRAIANALVDAGKKGAVTVVGGGDSVAAVAGMEDQLSHVSTGGGASLEFLEGKELPGVAALEDA